MGTVLTRPQNNNEMGNACTKNNDRDIVKPASPPPRLAAVTVTTNSPSNHKDVAAVTIDHNDIKLRAESELSNSLQSSPSASFCVKSGSNVNCIKNGCVLSIILLPHQHTLFCERKQRVCTAAGKAQEMEVLRVQGLDLPLTNSVWIRTSPGAPPTSVYSAIPNTENCVDYVLTADDVNCYISFRHAWMEENVSPVGGGSDASGSRPGSQASQVRVIQAEHAIGPVTAGPARLLDLRIMGRPVSGTATDSEEKKGEVEDDQGNGVLQVHYCVVAKVNYIGGKQGCSEFWWLKTYPDGRREDLTKRTAVPKDAIDCSCAVDINTAIEALPEEFLSDPRVYVIRPEDAGCTLKVKCVPRRSDGYEGEVCTSKPSAVILGAPGAAAAGSGGVIGVEDEPLKGLGLEERTVLMDMSEATHIMSSDTSPRVLD